MGYSFLAFIVFSVLFRVVAESGMGATGLGRIILVTRIMLIAWIGSMIFITVQRLKNIGNSGWWSVLLFVPLANIFLGLRCLVCPAGYADNKRLDRAGKIMTGFLLTAFLSAAWTVASMYLNG